MLGILNLLRTVVANSHRLIRYDPRGTGLSDWDVADISLDAWVNDVETVVNAAGVERFLCSECHRAALFRLLTLCGIPNASRTSIPIVHLRYFCSPQHTGSPLRPRGWGTLQRGRRTKWRATESCCRHRLFASSCCFRPLIGDLSNFNAGAVDVKFLRSNGCCWRSRARPACASRGDRRIPRMPLCAHQTHSKV